MTFLDKVRKSLMAGRNSAKAAQERSEKGEPQRRLKASTASRVSATSLRNGAEKAAPPFDTRRIFYVFLFALLFLALYLTYMLMQPFWHTIILACIFSGLIHPLYSRIRKKTGLNDYFASALTLGLLVIVFCIPLAFFLTQLIPQATVTIRSLALWLSGNHLDAFLNDKVIPFLHYLNDDVLTMVDIGVEDLQSSIMNLSRSAGQKLVGWGTGFVLDSVTILANFMLMLLIMFFLLKDGKALVLKLRQLTPLRPEQEENILQSLHRMASAVLIGGFSVAALQGLTGGIGLMLVGIPPLFWGSLMAAAALVPVVGTGLVWVPMVIYLALMGQHKSALFFAVWCGVLVTSIDSILRPIIMRGNSKVSLLFLFMSVFGGIKAFGALGIIYGPLILSFVLAMLNIYSTEFEENLTEHKFNNPTGVHKHKLPSTGKTKSPRRYGAASRMLREKNQKTERSNQKL